MMSELENIWTYLNYKLDIFVTQDERTHNSMTLKRSTETLQMEFNS